MSSRFGQIPFIHSMRELNFIMSATGHAGFRKLYFPNTGMHFLNVYDLQGCKCNTHGQYIIQCY
jgi:hypothetical protein